MESGHAEAAVLLIEAGADRHRVQSFLFALAKVALLIHPRIRQLNQDGEAPEEVEGVGGPEQKRAREYVISRVGKP
jgi:26S proteasome non-ATPase regulatory subunit 10